MAGGVGGGVGSSSEAERVRYVVKFITIGASRVGKTTLLRRWLVGAGESLPTAYSPTLGFEFAARPVPLGVLEGAERVLGRGEGDVVGECLSAAQRVPEEALEGGEARRMSRFFPRRPFAGEMLVRVMGIDTVGQERFQSVSRSYVTGAHAIFLVFDASDRKSFSEMRRWRRFMDDARDPRVPVVVLGNKIDLRGKDAASDPIPAAEAREWAEKHGFTYRECSARTGEGVDVAILDLAARGLKFMKDDEEELDRASLASQEARRSKTTPFSSSSSSSSSSSFSSSSSTTSKPHHPGRVTLGQSTPEKSGECACART